MSKHTPGPWTFRRARSGEHRWWIEGPGGDEKPWYIAETAGRGQENEANARLIAAAPELLAALQDFIAMGQQYGWDDATTGRAILMNVGRRAIAKAEPSR